MTVAVFTTTGAQTWTVPAGVTSIDIECIGAGGDAWGSGGGGGGYSKTAGLAVTPSATIWINVGLGAHLASGTDSWASKTSNASPASTSDGAMAKGGAFQQDGNTISLGGQASAGVGTTKFSGGHGGDPSPNFAKGGSGGGAAGPNGNGGNGGLGDGLITGWQGGGAGAANGGGNGGNYTANVKGGDGGLNRSAAGSGAGATSSTGPGAGSGGGGGGGGYNSGDTSQDGTTDIISAWGASYGPGSGSAQADNVGNGGLYGGGTAFYGSSVGIPGQGIVVITYTAAAATAKAGTLSMMGVG